MAAKTSEQQNALKDAMARAKQIAAKLQNTPPGQSSDGDGSQKRGANGTSSAEPTAKKSHLDSVDHTDPKVIAQQIANSLAKRSTLGPMLVEELLIPNKIVGLVIGKGGEMINKLQMESGAKVQIAHDPPQEMAGMMDRQITITGTSEAVLKAKALLSEIQCSGKIPEQLLSGTLPGEFSVEMNISKPKVGLIIGKGGENIKSLMERADCKMVLFQDGIYANTPEKLLRISGEQGAVMYGKQLVHDLLTSKELESINPNRRPVEGPGYLEMAVPRETVGLIIGAKGVNIQQIQSETGCRVRFKNEMEGPTKTAMLSGTPQQVAAARVKIEEVIRLEKQGEKPQFNGPGGGAGGPGRPGGPRPAWDGPPGPHATNGPPQEWGQQPGPRNFANKNPNLPEGHKDAIVEVPASKCGFVIGKGGETIKFIKNESKVNIQIDRSIPETAPFRIFRVQGTDEMIEKALIIIREKTNDWSINVRSVGDEEPPTQNPWGDHAQQQQNRPWDQQQQWPGQQQQQQQHQQQQPGWGPQQQQQPPSPQQQQGSWNQQSQPQQEGGPGWNQQQMPQQQQWNPQQQQQQQQQGQQQPQQQPQQQWQQQNTAPQGQWAQQQWGQPQTQASDPAQVTQQAYQQSQTAASAVVVSADPTQAAPAAQQVAGQPDYSAAWALYYQQQQQYYQQYAMQQVAVSSAAVSSAVASTVPTQGTTNSMQAQAMAQYQAQLAQYQSQFVQQTPQ